MARVESIYLEYKCVWFRGDVFNISKQVDGVKLNDSDTACGIVSTMTMSMVRVGWILHRQEEFSLSLLIAVVVFRRHWFLGVISWVNQAKSTLCQPQNETNGIGYINDWISAGQPI